MKIFNKKILGLLISIFFIALIFHQIDIKKSFEAFKNINWAYFPLIIPIYYLSFFIRAHRWKTILFEKPLLKIRSLISSLFIGFTANCLLPARMGEFYRAHLFGKKENIKRATVFASIVLERIFDGSILFFILLSLVSFIYQKPWLVKLCIIAGSIFIGGFIFLLIFAKLKNLVKLQNNSQFVSILNPVLKTLSNLPESIQNVIGYIFSKIRYFWNSFIDGLSIFHSFELLFKSFSLTLLVWLLEGLVVFIVISGFGIHINFLSALFVMCVTAFSTMIPSGPASVGPYQWGYILALSVFGVEKETAFAVSVVNQLIGVSLVSISGFFFMWRDHINIKDLEDDIEIEKELESAF